MCTKVCACVVGLGDGTSKGYVCTSDDDDGEADVVEMELLCSTFELQL